MKKAWKDVLMDFLRGNLWAKIVIAVCLILLAFCLFGCSLLEPSVGFPPMDANGDGILDQAYRDAIHNARVAVDTVSGGATAPATGILELLITGGSAVAVALGARKVDHVMKAKKQAAK
jgi:hypothetical protein